LEPNSSGKKGSWGKRPRLTEVEIELIHTALLKAGYDQEAGTPEFRLYVRFSHFKKGSYIKPSRGY